MLLTLLDVTPQQLQEAKGRATKEQLVAALTKGIDAEDTPEKFQGPLRKQIERLNNSAKVMAELDGPLRALHAKTGGKIPEICVVFDELSAQSSPNQPKEMPPGMVQALLRVPPEATECTVEQLVYVGLFLLLPQDIVITTY